MESSFWQRMVYGEETAVAKPFVDDNAILTKNLE